MKQLFDGGALAAAERSQAARWIAARQGLSGSYSGTFAGFPSERSKGIVLFTGERIASARTSHSRRGSVAGAEGAASAGSQRRARARRG